MKQILLLLAPFYIKKKFKGISEGRLTESKSLANKYFHVALNSLDNKMLNPTALVGRESLEARKIHLSYESKMAQPDPDTF